MNLKIPKNLKKIRNVNINPKDLITFEKKIQKEYEKGKIKSPVHLSSGNEKELISIFQYISPNDWVFSGWRNHYHALLHGISEEYLFNELSYEQQKIVYIVISKIKEWLEFPYKHKKIHLCLLKNSG